MKFRTPSQRNAEAYRQAIETMTGVSPFIESDGTHYIVEDPEYGPEYQRAIRALLERGVPPTECTLSQVEAEVRGQEI